MHLYHNWFVRCKIKSFPHWHLTQLKLVPKLKFGLFTAAFATFESKLCVLEDRWAGFFCTRCSTKPNIDQEQFIGDNVPICSVPILSAVAHKSSVHLRPNRFHSRLFYCTCRNFEGEGAAITEFWESERGRGGVLDNEKI